MHVCIYVCVRARVCVCVCEYVLKCMVLQFQLPKIYLDINNG